MEILKTLRFLNQFLVLVSAAVFLFALTPDPAPEYNAALDEVASLRQTMDSGTDYARFVHDRFKDSLASDRDYLLGVVRVAGADVMNEAAFKQPFACDCVPTGGKVSSYDFFLSGTRSFAPVRIDHNANLVGQLRRQIAIQHPHPGVNLGHIEVPGSFALPDGTPVIRIPDAQPNADRTIEFFFNDPQSKQRLQFGVNVFVNYTIGPMREGRFALDWLKSTESGRHLIDEKSGIILPNLKKLSFWNQVSQMGTGDATKLIQDRIDRLESGKVSFLGISVDKKVAVWLGPSTCFLVLFYFWLHLRHFLLLTVSDKGDLSYPWVPLFRGVRSGVVAISSVFLVPTIPNVILLFRYGQWHQLSTLFGAVFTVGITGLGVWTAADIRRLRSMVVNLR